MRRHTLDGAEIVTPISELARDAAGRAQPPRAARRRGLSGRPASTTRSRDRARIIAVADTYDAMTTSRPYRAALSSERAADEIRAGRASSTARGWWRPSTA